LRTPLGVSLAHSIAGQFGRAATFQAPQAGLTLLLTLQVRMYVYEEMIDGKPLTEIINTTHENVKYLKGAKFTPNVRPRSN